MRRLCLTALLLALMLAGCGGGDGSSEESVAPPPLRGPKPPPGASALLRQVYRNFQPPLPDPEVPGSAKAIRVGEAACKGKRPAEVVKRYLARSELSAAQREALEDLERAEASPSADFVAGQLAAMVYEGALEGELAPYGYRGCVYGLALGLKGELEAAGSQAGVL